MASTRRLAKITAHTVPVKLNPNKIPAWSGRGGPEAPPLANKVLNDGFCELESQLSLKV